MCDGLALRGGSTSFHTLTLSSAVPLVVCCVWTVADMGETMNWLLVVVNTTTVCLQLSASQWCCSQRAVEVWGGLQSKGGGQPTNSFGEEIGFLSFVFFVLLFVFFSFTVP